MVRLPFSNSGPRLGAPGVILAGTRRIGSRRRRVQASTILLFLVACSTPRAASVEPLPPGVEREYEDDPSVTLGILREVLERSEWHVFEVQALEDGTSLVRARPRELPSPAVVGAMPRILRIRVIRGPAGGTIVEFLAERAFAERMFRDLDQRLRRKR